MSSKDDDVRHQSQLMNENEHATNISLTVVEVTSALVVLVVLVIGATGGSD